MSIRQGDKNELVRKWRSTMNARFGPLYTRARGPMPSDTNEFGPRARSWQQEYQLRTKQFPDGVVSDNDLRALGLSTTVPNPPASSRQVLLTVHGTGQPDPMGPGLPADTARAVLDKYDWQGIGNYSAAAFPMWPSVLEGVAELNAQIDRYPGRPINLAGYSQGAIVVGQVLKHDIMNPRGRLHHRLGDVRKVVFWGNPMRQQGIADFDEWIHPIAPADSHGILTEDLLEGLEDAPFQVRDYAHAGDMYACNKDNDTDEYKRAICKIIMRATDFFNGPDSVVSQLTELGQRPLQEGIAMAMAMIQALQFFMGSAHGYNIGPAIEFLRAP